MNRINISYEYRAIKNCFIMPIIKRCIRTVLEQEGVDVDCEINVLITNDTGIRNINNANRNIDKATDVLSFPMFELTAGELPDNWAPYIDPDSGRCPLGDMAISIERAIAQAKEFGHSTRREIGYLTIHSVLHLLGYDHMDDGVQKAQMRKREEEIASKIPRMKRD